MSYKIIKIFSDGSQIFVNDSEGIPMEWDNPNDALVVSKKYQELSKSNSRYIVVDLTKNQFEIDEELIGI